MKRFIILVVAVLCLGLCSCGPGKEQTFGTTRVIISNTTDRNLLLRCYQYQNVIDITPENRLIYEKDSLIKTFVIEANSDYTDETLPDGIAVPTVWLSRLTGSKEVIDSISYSSLDDSIFIYHATDGNSNYFSSTETNVMVVDDYKIVEKDDISVIYQFFIDETDFDNALPLD